MDQLLELQFAQIEKIKYKNKRNVIFSWMLVAEINAPIFPLLTKNKLMTFVT